MYISVHFGSFSFNLANTGDFLSCSGSSSYPSNIKQTLSPPDAVISSYNTSRSFLFSTSSKSPMLLAACISGSRSGSNITASYSSSNSPSAQHLHILMANVLFPMPGPPSIRITLFSSSLTSSTSAMVSDLVSEDDNGIFFIIILFNWPDTNSSLSLFNFLSNFVNNKLT